MTNRAIVLAAVLGYSAVALLNERMDDMSKTPMVDALVARWADNGATRGSAYMELRDVARRLERKLAASETQLSDSQDEVGRLEKLLTKEREITAALRAADTAELDEIAKRLHYPQC